jgi:phosphohistidine phosphatase
MSKKIILLRHAQTAGKQAGQRDYDRTLTPEGEVNAKKIGEFLLRNSIRPDILISSSAVRARQTSLLLNESIHLSPDQLAFLDALYEADGDTWLQQIHQLDNAYHTAICVGHNPTLSWLAGHLAARPIDLPPAGMVVFSSPKFSWTNVDHDLRELVIAELP